MFLQRKKKLDLKNSSLRSIFVKIAPQAVSDMVSFVFESGLTDKWVLCVRRTSSLDDLGVSGTFAPRPNTHQTLKGPF